MINTQLYKKVGRRYIPIGYIDGFTGFPTEGIWAVFQVPGMTTNSCIAQVGEFQPIDYSKLASLIKEKEDKCHKALSKLKESSWSQRDIIRTIFETLLKEDEDKT